MLLAVWGTGNFGNPATNGHLSITSATLFPQTTGGIYNTVYGFSSNNTFWFSVTQLEISEPVVPNGRGLSFQITTTGPTTVTFATLLPPTVSCTCTASMVGFTETLTFVSGLSLSSFTLVWSIRTEAQNVLFRDDFLYTNPLIESSWTIDKYVNPGTNVGIQTSSGYLVFNALPSVSIATVHVTTPMFQPSAYTTGIAVKRKMTVTLIPFMAKEANTATVKAGLGPLLSTGGYPGTLPSGTPNTNFNNACTDSANTVDNIGLEFLSFQNNGNVVGTACGDPSGTQTTGTIATGLDPAKYTVFTVETYGIFCSSCTDNAYSGSSWVYFRVYQENAANQIISSTDHNLNMTSNVAPLYQTSYGFISQSNGNNAATNQVSKIDMIQVQNYGSPVCLISPGGGALCTRLPLVPSDINHAGDIAGIMAWLANQIGFGDEQAGAILLFIFMSAGFVGSSLFLSRNLTVGGSMETALIGFFVYVGFFPIWVLILVFIAAVALITMIILQFLRGGESIGE